MSLTNSFDVESNFWEINPQFTGIFPFKKLYKSDKTRGKHGSSTIMWFVAQVVDPNKKNIIRNLPFDERVDLMSSDFMEDEKYYEKNEEVLTPLINKYRELVTTAAHQALEEWNSKMLDRAAFIKKTPYTIDTYEYDPVSQRNITIKGTAKVLDDMMKATKGIYDQYHMIMKSLSEEEEESTAKGGQQLSLSDQGLI